MLARSSGLADCSTFANSAVFLSDSLAIRAAACGDWPASRCQAARCSTVFTASCLELPVPAADLAELRASLREQLTLHTIFYLAGDVSRGGAEPTLIGFLRADDKRFFNKFTTVKGIGVKTALRALTVPVGQIAQAIESRDARFLTSLDGIGKRTAELMIAELAGKVGEFAAPMTATIRSSQSTLARRTPIEEDAISALMQ